MTAFASLCFCIFPACRFGSSFGLQNTRVTSLVCYLTSVWMVKVTQEIENDLWQIKKGHVFFLSHVTCDFNICLSETPTIIALFYRWRYKFRKKYRHICKCTKLFRFLKFCLISSLKYLDVIKYHLYTLPSEFAVQGYDVPNGMIQTPILWQDNSLPVTWPSQKFHIDKCFPPCLLHQILFIL